MIININKNLTRHIAVKKINVLRNKYFNAVKKNRSFFTLNKKLVVTKFAKFYLLHLEKKYKTLN